MSRFLSFMLFAALGTTTGCGGGGVSADGKLVDGASPYAMTEGEAITLTLTSEDGKNICTAVVEKDSSFVVKSTNGQAMQPGKYKVSIIHYQQPTTKSNAPGGSQGAAPGSHAPKDTGEVWDVSATAKSFVLDMSKLKPAGKKK